QLEADFPILNERLEATRRDVAARLDTRGDLFEIELGGQSIRDRGIAGELINRQAARVQGTGQQFIGNFAGFRLFVAGSFAGGADLMFRGAAAHQAKVSESALGTIHSLEYAVQNLDEMAGRIERD